MERRPGGGRRLVAVVLALSCLLLPVLVSSAPLSRSLRMSSLHQHPPSLNFSADETAAARGLSRRPAARMDVEVNDYPGSGPNNRHDPPKGPGRA
uniref:Uncharacterized protein n=2 Tax=Oryza brachyantha TaxID=4533 RepID=J3M8A7_ORYBR